MIRKAIATAMAWAAAAAAARRARQRRLDEVGEGRLADPAERQRGDGDAELGRGEVGIEVAEGSLQRAGIGRPASTSSVTRLRRTATRENSAATKKPLAKTRAKTARIRRREIRGSSEGHRAGRVDCEGPSFGAGRARRQPRYRAEALRPVSAPRPRRGRVRPGPSANKPVGSSACGRREYRRRGGPHACAPAPARPRCRGNA